MNGASVEIIGPFIEGFFAIAAAVVFSVYEERDFFLYCLPAYPTIIYASFMMWKYQKGLTVYPEDEMEEANDYTTEMIVNYQTSQSFGYTDRLVEKYKTML